MDWVTAIAAGIGARQEKDQDLWTLGDLALEIETAYGHEYLPAFADAIGVRYDLLKTYLWVASVYAKDDRVVNLTWSHHRAVAADPDRLEILATAAVEGTPVDSLPIIVKLKRVRERLEEAERVINRLKEEWDS